MNSILRRSFKLARMTSVQIRGMHASESPRFREFRRENPRQVINFIQSLASNEEKLAFWHYDEINKPSNDPDNLEIIYMPDDFEELAADLLQQPDELTPQMLYQLSDLLKFTLSKFEKAVLSERLRDFFTDREKGLPASDISFVLDSFRRLSDIENVILMDQSFISRDEFSAIDTNEYEDFYSRHSSKFGLRDYVMFVFLYAYQSGYKLSFVESIMNSIHSNYDEIESDNAYKTVLTFLKVIYDDFEKTSQESHSIEQHPLFATFKKFDQKFTFKGLPSIKYLNDNDDDLFERSLESKVNESLPKISKFIWRCLIDISKKKIISSPEFLDLCYDLCEQSIDLNETEIEALVDNAKDVLRSENYDEFNQMRALRVLSRLAFKGL